MRSKTGFPRVIGRRAMMGSALAGLPVLAGCGMFDDDEKPTLAGHRIDVLSTGAGLTIDHDDQTPIAIPGAGPVSSWPQAGRLPTHDAANANWGGTKKLWSRSIGKGISEPSFLSFVALGSNGRGAIQSTPVIGGGRIFTTDAVGTVRAWTWPEMKQVWSLVPATKKMRSTNIGGGIGLDGDMLYIVDGVAQTLAVDAATGTVKWRIDLGTPGRSAPTIVDGRVFFGTIDERLFALDAATGRQIWTYTATPADTVIFGQAAPAVSDGIVLAGFGSGDLVALRAESGEVVWSDSLGGSNGRSETMDFACVRGAPVIADGTAYAVSLSRVLVAIDMRSGRRLWEREISSQNDLCVCGEWLYVVSDDQQIACLDRLSGHVRWITQLRRFVRVDAQKNAINWIGPLMVNGMLCCISTWPKNGMATVDAVTGKIQEILTTSNASFVAPIVCDGQVLVLGNDGNLTAYG